MGERTSRRTKTWERRHLACFFSTHQRAGQRPNGIKLSDRVGFEAAYDL
jgi:hypothetical protein